MMSWASSSSSSSKVAPEEYCKEEEAEEEEEEEVDVDLRSWVQRLANQVEGKSPEEKREILTARMTPEAMEQIWRRYGLPSELRYEILPPESNYHSTINNDGETEVVAPAPTLITRLDGLILRLQSLVPGLKKWHEQRNSKTKAD